MFNYSVVQKKYYWRQYIYLAGWVRKSYRIFSNF